MKRTRPYDAEAAGALCSKCALRGIHRPVPPKGPPDAGIVLVGEGPGMTEIERGSAFIGPSGRLLVDLLAEAWKLLPPGVPKATYDQLWITNATLCRSRNGDLTTFLKRKWLADVARNRKWREDNIRLKRAGRPLVERPELKLSPLDACWPRLLKELSHPARKVIVPVGQYALLALDDTRKGIVKWRGGPFPWAPPPPQAGGAF